MNTIPDGVNSGRIWSFAFYFVFFAAVAAFFPYLVPYYQALGFSGSQIGFLTAVPPLITLLAAPFWTRLADATNRHRTIMGVSLLMCTGGLILLPLAQSFGTVLAVAVSFYLFFAPVLALADSATMVGLGESKALYGRLRLGGTIGFGIFATIAGILVQDRGMPFAFWMAAGLLLLALFVAQPFAYREPERRDLDEASGDDLSLVALLKNPQWGLFLTLAFVGGVALTAGGNYFFPFMEEIGASEATMGVTLTIGTIGEIPVLLFANRLVQRFKAYGVLVLSTLITGVRFILFALAGDPGVVMVIQLLNGFTFPLLSVAGVAYADEHAPPRLRATAQGLFNAVLMGIGAAVGGLVGGLLLENIGARGLYMSVGWLTLMVLAVVVFLRSKATALPPAQR